ncbi:putative cytochrome P450 [Diplogelasinospora grovesii]|uniref:Cytochrome P450 n=1 Tax=Diplogelasinospora grovesii TaxID=303347 RepID=A0AAN6NHY3_9PEZI|nr:putative cytochrome P450 [Diplogelasinospora grovesii]
MALMSALLSALLWPALGLASFTLYCAVCLTRNYLIARRIGLPIRVIPIDHTNPFWMMVDRKVLSFVKKLPGFLGDNDFTRFNFRAWEMYDRLRPHREMGDAFIIVTPQRIWFYLADPEALMECFRRRLDFPRCTELTEILNVFGTNLSTVEGQQWKTQRKIIATCFNEQNSEIVWSESVSLARDMLAYWSKKPSVSSSADDLRTLSLHVLSGAGFGKSFKFEGHDERPNTSVSANYKSSLQTILENCVLILALGPGFLTKARPWLPSTWKLARLADTCAAFQRYMTDQYEEEKKRTEADDAQEAKKTGRAANKTLMSSLVRASQAEAATSTGTGTGGLSESEIYGNMFMLNFAGHDTTAHTFTFAIYFLAANPDVQDWISEEARAVLGGNDWDYATSFPRLKRCLAVMYETLRLYTIVPVSKWVGENQTGGGVSLEVAGKTIVLPPKTMFIPSYAAVQTDPKYWGPDALVWRPSRWIVTQEGGGRPPAAGEEELITIRKGTFLGWSEGARDCPGKKFSQVEFVATVATLLRDWRVDPAPLHAGESPEDARKRVLDLIEHDSAPVLLLQMLHPERAPLTWRKR